MRREGKRERERKKIASLRPFDAFSIALENREPETGSSSSKLPVDTLEKDRYFIPISRISSYYHLIATLTLAFINFPYRDSVIEIRSTKRRDLLSEIKMGECHAFFLK